MAETFTQLAIDSSGNKMRESEKTIGSDTVREQAVFQAAAESWLLCAESIAFANNKQHVSIYNGAGSGVIVRIRKLFAINMIENAISGGIIRLNVRQATGFSGGTDLTPIAQDTNNLSIPSEVLFKTNATVTEGSLLFPLIMSNDELLLTQNSMAQNLLAGINWIPEGFEVQELTLREGEGFTIRQITNNATGIFTWLILFSVAEE